MYNINNEISNNLFKIRYHNKYKKYFSQKELSKILKISQTQISRIENGNIPKLNEIIKYAVFFEISIDDIVFKKYDIETREFIKE